MNGRMLVDDERSRRLEEQWNLTEAPRRLLDLYHAAAEATTSVDSRSASRTWRLAAAAFCRILWPLLEECEEGRRAVEVAEAAADGKADERALYEAGEAVRRARVDVQKMCWYDDGYVVGLVCGPEDYAQFAAFDVTDADPMVAAITTARWAERCFHRDQVVASRQAELHRQLRDILGDPFHPIQIDPAWLMPPVPSLALAIRREQRFEAMPILADALEEAGCDDARLLGHLRAPGPHWAGCHALDLLTEHS